MDANIWMYASGPESPHRAACVEITRPPTLERLNAMTDAEVLQECLYRYSRMGRTEGAIALVRRMLVVLGASCVLPVTSETMRRCVDLMESQPRLSPRDLIHVAVMQEAGVTRICSYDRGFDAVPGIRRVEPAVLLEAG